MPKTRQILVHFAQKLSQIQPTLYPSTCTCNPSVMAMPMSVLQTVTMITDQGHTYVPQKKRDSRAHQLEGFSPTHREMK